MTDNLRVIIFRDCDLWSAQCLEYDIGAQASDLDTLKLRLIVVLDMEYAENLELFGEPFSGIGQAPERFQIMWEHRSRAFDADGHIEMRPGHHAVRVDMGLAA